MRQRGHSEEITLEIAFEELKSGWGYMKEMAGYNTELYNILNTIGIVLIVIVAVYTLGKILLFHKASEPILFAIIPFAGIWTIHKLAWNSGKATFICLIPGLGLMFLLLTMIVLCSRFNGNILAYILSFVFAPFGIFYLGLTGKYEKVNTDSYVQNSNITLNNMPYTNNNLNTGTAMDKDDFQARYDEVWGDVLKK